ncbi:MAG TPA: sigma-70 family RNA polymerase sigma factor [Phycisphaerae bacterium]|nr:sigma-70 family RNA polymerase sigma factor [Phycisphaerae bacterium]HOJ75838.1 sigma-70 family RNA polymerase sigma factor [Phycisphaerae bacterium]HOM53224.1 sigma-70 family RNA polymerase sigma factor [Phycisphaerae bacterium]HON68099.1 sigma-70 family RNA polymerase sigma factor [Phycisphaerae bacterium]HOQ86020.1 sigma-70 family RNA polymerase sigma factor [Phycisphaerae bacterium]
MKAQSEKAKVSKEKDDKELAKLWKRFLETREDELRNQLVERYASLVHIQAARLSRKLPAQISYDEICSAGYDGLIEAVESYNPERKAKFETFCQQRIIGAVMDWLRSLDPQSRTVRNFEKRRMGVREMLDSELGRPPMHDEIARHMGISQDRYDQLSRISQLGREVHFSAMDPRSDSRGRSNDRAWDIGDPDQTDPSARLAHAMLTEFITRGLSREERLVLILYYYEDLTMAEIGVVLDLSESRVSQIHKDVILRLRNRFKGKLEGELVA